MSSRYDDRDHDRESQNRGRRSESDYGRSWGGRSQGRYRYGDNDRENERYGRERGYGNESRGRGAESSGRSREYGGGSQYSGGQYGGGSEYGRGGEAGRYSSGSRSDYQSGRQTYGSYGQSNRENRHKDVEDRDEKYGGYMGGYGQGYNDPFGSYSRGYNESSRGSERGRSYDYDRGSYGGSGSRYGEGESRNWTGDDRSSQSDKGDWSGGYGSRESRDAMNARQSGDWSGSYSGRESRDWNDQNRWIDDRDRGQQQRGWWDRASDEVASWFGDEEAERRRKIDARRGRGPKGYQRSDERIKEDVSDRLTDDYYVDASDIEVQVSSAEVILTGTVNSRNEKRRAEDLAESAKGVRNVENRLRVQRGNSTYNELDSNRTTGATMGSATAGAPDTGSLGTSGGSTPLGTGSGTGMDTGIGTGSSLESSTGLSTGTETETSSKNSRSKSTGTS